MEHIARIATPHTRRSRGHRAAGARRRYRARVLSTPDVVLIAVCAACLTLTALGAIAAPDHPGPAEWAPVLIAERATLWDLAREHPIPGLSTAETVSLIRERNGMADASLAVGESLEVPIGSSASVALAARP